MYIVVQMERNLEKEMGYHPTVPDTALSGELSSVYCVLDHDQYWLIRNILDHNTGEAIPDFPQPLASLQPPAIQVETDVYTRYLISKLVISY